jgi:hypothetical protein
MLFFRHSAAENMPVEIAEYASRLLKVSEMWLLRIDAEIADGTRKEDYPGLQFLRRPFHKYTSSRRPPKHA